MRSLILAISAMLAITGCSTTVVSTSEATAGTALPGAPVHQTPNSVPVIVKRDTGMISSACSTRVFLNGAPVADLRTGQAVTLFVSPGKHMAGARPNGICGGGDSELEFDTTDRRPRTFRISIDFTGAMKLQPTAF